VPMQRTPGGKWVVIKPEEQPVPGPRALWLQQFADPLRDQ
jgi:hypothetical protein